MIGRRRRTIRVTANLPSDVVDAVRYLAAKRRVTMTRVIEQAIGTENFLAAIHQDRGEVLIEARDGGVRRMVPR